MTSKRVCGLVRSSERLEKRAVRRRDGRGWLGRRKRDETNHGGPLFKLIETAQGPAGFQLKGARTEQGGFYPSDLDVVIRTLRRQPNNNGGLNLWKTP